MTTINKDSVFALIDRIIPEQLYEFCPFCGSGYASEWEVRATVKQYCPVCQGQASLARDAVIAIEALYTLLPSLPRTRETLEQVEIYIRKLGAGYWRSEYRAFWRQLQDELGDGIS